MLIINVGGSRYIDPTFFEWDLKPALTVQFYDRTKTKAVTDVIAYVWVFGDGNGGTGANPEHQYSLPGDYNVTLYTYFSSGEVESFSTEVRVVDNAISEIMFIIMCLVVFIGIIIVGVYAVKNKTKRLNGVMLIILGSFIMIVLSLIHI